MKRKPECTCRIEWTVADGRQPYIVKCPLCKAAGKMYQTMDSAVHFLLTLSPTALGVDEDDGFGYRDEMVSRFNAALGEARGEIKP